MIKDSGNKNAIQERHTIVLGDNAVVVTGFYEFTRMKEGKPVPGPSRFTMQRIDAVPEVGRVARTTNGTGLRDLNHRWPAPGIVLARNT
jgi:hypothetical protein